MWPEPPKRVSPPVRTALVLPNGVTCPDGCEHFSSSEDPDPLTVSKLKYAALTYNGSFHKNMFTTINVLTFLEGFSFAKIVRRVCHLRSICFPQ